MRWAAKLRSREFELFFCVVLQGPLIKQKLTPMLACALVEAVVEVNTGRSGLDTFLIESENEIFFCFQYFVELVLCEQIRPMSLWLSAWA